MPDLVSFPLRGKSFPNNNNIKIAKTTPSTETGIKSTFHGIQRYSGVRGSFHPNVFAWLKGKRRDDDIGNFWRVHDKLYDLREFITKHPGGSDWIEFSQGTDITEAFEASHFVNVLHVERILEKYYIADAVTPRNSPYTFYEDGFYKTLKRRAEPIIKEIGMDVSWKCIAITDLIAFLFVLASITSYVFSSTTLAVIAGLLLAMLASAAHNFFHKRDNWRSYYFDFSVLSSYEWKISHAFSHHLYPNTILDFEVLMGEPLVEMLPIRPKSNFHKYILPVIIELMYLIYGIEQIPIRVISILQGKQKLRPENLIVLLELAIAVVLSPSLWAGLSTWTIILCTSTFWFAFVSNNSSHHHTDCFHDGDEARPNPDFGLCQLDATASKTDSYHQNIFSVLTTFGEHPLHHLFPTVCHGKLEHLRNVVHKTLEDFSEEILEFTQWQLFISTHKQLGRTKCNEFRNKKAK